MRSVDISQPALTGCHRTDVTLPHPDAIPSDQPCWLPGMSESSFLPSLGSYTWACIPEQISNWPEGSPALKLHSSLFTLAAVFRRHEAAPLGQGPA